MAEASVRIGLNLCTLRGKGSSAIGRGVLSGLLRAEKEHTYEAWVPREWGTAAHGDRVVAHPCRSGPLEKLRIENGEIRAAAERGSIDKLLSLTDTSVLRCRVPHLLLVQQAYLAYPASRWPAEASGRFLAKMAWMQTYFAAGLRSVGAITVQGEAMKRHLAEKWRFPEERIFVVPSAVDIPPAAQIGQRPAEPYVCYVATASPHKRHAVLAQVMAALERRGFGLRCTLTVEAMEVPTLVEAARRLGVLGRFDFLGDVGRDDALGLLAGARAMIMPSILESFGLPYYEAMALGCPVVAADTEFAREALGEAGLYSERDSAEGFAEHLASILESDEKRRALSEAGMARFRRIRVTWDEVAARYLEILERL